MLLHLRNVLTAAQLAELRAGLAAAGGDWIDGRASAGFQGAPVKRNRQLAEGSASAQRLGDLVLAAFERNPQFIGAALPNRVYPPMFNRYEVGMGFGDHIDNALRLIPGTAAKLRTDVSVTLFLSAPEDYDGGELLIEDRYGAQSVKLPAGDAIVYPASSLHRVAPVTRGTRLASFFWVQSLVADDAQRCLLFDLDGAIQRLAATNADAIARTQLTGSYHNLLRMWSQP